MSGNKEINPMYTESSQAMDSEIKRMQELEWPLRASGVMLPKNLNGQKVADIGAGPNTSLRSLVEARGGNFVPLDKNLKMTEAQSKAGESVQGDITQLPFRDGSVDIVHSRFVLMNLNENLRPTALKELARVGKEVVILDYDWAAFESNEPSVKKFIGIGKALGILAGSDLYFGEKLKGFVQENLNINPTEIRQVIFNDGPIKDYKTLTRLAESMLGLAKNLLNIYVHEEMKKKLNIYIEDLVELTKIFGEFSENPDQAQTFISPDIVGVSFKSNKNV